MATGPQIAYLFRQYMLDNASDQELLQLKQWLEKNSGDEQAAAILSSLYEPDTTPVAPDQKRLNAILSRIAEEQQQQQPTRVIKLNKWKWAAACSLLIAAGIYFYSNREKNTTQPTTITQKEKNILPGKAGAILTLEDGSQLVLDSLNNGTIATQNGTEVNLNNGQLSYDPQSRAAATLTYNTMTTPRGRQFQLTLPDGTKVWLNAASSITYPTAFADNNRSVKISGEVFLEVAANKHQPFIIDVDGRSKVEVLGTSLNINSYTDEESIRTTLLEGSVKMTSSTQSTMLKPGQQAEFSASQKTLSLINNPDIEKTIAWKNGLFNFNGADLYTVMRQLERWYNIEVRYTGAKSNIIFGGETYRDVQLEDVLAQLQKWGVKFKLEGDILTVL